MILYKVQANRYGQWQDVKTTFNKKEAISYKEQMEEYGYPLRVAIEK